jgi:hypothetical protein
MLIIASTSTSSITSISTSITIVTLSTTSTSFFTVPTAIGKRAVVPTIPAYASDCPNIAAYQTACSCLGIVSSIVTVSTTLPPVASFEKFTKFPITNKTSQPRPSLPPQLLPLRRHPPLPRLLYLSVRRLVEISSSMATLKVAPYLHGPRSPIPLSIRERITQILFLL